MNWFQNYFADISTERLLLAAGIFLGAGILAQVLHWWLKKIAHRTTSDSNPARPRVWQNLLSAAAASPLTLLIWVWGASAALSFIAKVVTDPDQAERISTALHWLNIATLLIAGIWFALFALQIAEVWLRHWFTEHGTKWDLVLTILLVRALRLSAPFVAIILLLPAFHISPAYDQVFAQLSSLVLIGLAGFILVQLATTLEKTVLQQFPVDAKDNLATRKVYTQVRMLKKIAVITVVLLTLACMLMVFQPVRHLGASMLASAGVAGIVIGFAAQRTLTTFVAGMQIAFTQPIRLGDAVIVEGEWGTIEEITLTYVVVLIWDQRRLIVPITYFIEKPFQNWTRITAQLLGTVYLYVDYTVPIQALREELDRILENSKLWDHRVKSLQVTDSKERTLELRVLLSAADAGAAWDLRCEVREKLITYLQENHPACFPKLRLDPLPTRNGHGQQPPLDRDVEMQHP